MREVEKVRKSPDTTDRETVFMTGQELSHKLQKLGLTKVDFGRLINVGARTVRGWIAGEKPVPKLVALFVGLLLDTKVNPYELFGGIHGGLREARAELRAAGHQPYSDLAQNGISGPLHRTK